MKTVKTYPTRIEADIAKLALDAANIPSVVVGVGTAMEGGIAGAKLRVPEEAGARRRGENVDKSRRWSVNSSLVSRSNNPLSIQYRLLKRLGFSEAA